MVSLEQEIQLIDKYLSIESIRFDEMLSYKFDLEEKTLLMQIPDMLLQPIVENSIKHGMKKLRKKMHIEIKSTVENKRLKIEVKDNGKGFDTSNEGFIHKGIGLKNTLDRCKKIFGENRIEIRSKPNKGTTITFSFPISTKSDG